MLPTGQSPNAGNLFYSSLERIQNSGALKSPEKQEEGVYFSLSEIATLLDGSAFVDKQESGHPFSQC
jgi:hypothetical protein